MYVYDVMMDQLGELVPAGDDEDDGDTHPDVSCSDLSRLGRGYVLYRHRLPQESLGEAHGSRLGGHLAILAHWSVGVHGGVGVGTLGRGLPSGGGAARHLGGDEAGDLVTETGEHGHGGAVLAGAGDLGISVAHWQRQTGARLGCPGWGSLAGTTGRGHGSGCWLARISPHTPAQHNTVAGPRDLT